MLTALFQRESHSFLLNGAVGKYHGLSQIPDCQSVPHILFKWRPFDQKFGDGCRLREVFSRFDVVSALLLRRSIVAHSLKVYLSEKVYGGRHQQFKAGRMTTAEYQRYVQDQTNISIVLDQSDVNLVRDLAFHFFKITVQTFKRWRHFFSSVSDENIIISEDIFRPEIDFAEYSKRISFLMRDQLCFTSSNRISVRRAGLEVSNCRNSEIVMSDDYLMELENAYAVLVDGSALGSFTDADLESLAGSVRPRGWRLRAGFIRGLFTP